MATKKPSAYLPVAAESSTTHHHDVAIVHGETIVRGEIVTPFWDKRKRELCLAFTVGTLVGFILLAVVNGGVGHHAHDYPTPAMTVAPTQAPLPPPNATTVQPLQPPVSMILNETSSSPQVEEEEEAEEEQEQSWWSVASDTVTGWLGGGKHETKAAGGGRDWLVNAQTGLISSKQDPSFVLGVGPSPLILVTQDAPEKLMFLQTSDTMDLVAQDSMFVGFAKQDPQQVEGFDYFETVASPFVEPLSVTYKDGNFLVFKDEYVLDVADWEVVANQKVNFVKPLEDGTTFTPGGGRDWVLNDDGSVSPKLNLNLVLGKGSRGLVITQQEEQALHLMHSQELANGETVPMELSDELEGVGVKEVQSTDGWRYRDSILVDDTPVRINYDGNFILTSDEEFALDIAYWKLEEGNVVNFVGGDN